MKQSTTTEPTTHKTPLIGKREQILLAVIFLAVCGFWLFNRFLYSEPAAKVEVAIVDNDSNKTIIETFDLSKNTSFTIVTEPSSANEPRGTNQLVIEDGNVWISEANCPNQDCVKKGKISMNGEMLVCLPHRVTVSIVGE